MAAPPKVLIPVGLGLNCEAETAHAFRLLGVAPDLVHLTDLFSRRHSKRLPQYQVLVFVGGFAYGDHIAAGLVLATRVRAHLRHDLAQFLAGGGLVLGICNGFQTLVRLGLLPGPETGPADFLPRAALANNDRLGYRDAWVRLAVDPDSNCVWTRGLPALELPARHGEGKYVMESESALAAMEARGQVALRYVNDRGHPTEEWPFNPNGSARGVAGVSDSTGRILGLMPHPDAFLDPWRHPDYTHRRRDLDQREPAGLALFRAGLRGL